MFALPSSRDWTSAALEILVTGCAARRDAFQTAYVLGPERGRYGTPARAVGAGDDQADLIVPGEGTSVQAQRIQQGGEGAVPGVVRRLRLTQPPQALLHVPLGGRLPALTGGQHGQQCRAQPAPCYHRWYAGCPGFTATKVPRQVAQTWSPPNSSASTTTLLSLDSTTRATNRTGPVLGVGLSSFTWKSDVTVLGGCWSPSRVIRCQAAVQLEWQSNKVPTMPPLSTPAKASWWGSGRHSATTRSPSAKLRMCSPLGLAGP